MNNKNREIKFRIWDSVGKKWMEIFEVNLLDPNYLNNPEYPLQQFTGLHDKNGQEIYEGDIVSLGQKGGVWTEEDDYVVIDDLKGEIKWGEYTDEEYVSCLECWMIVGHEIRNLPLSCAIRSGGVSHGRGTEIEDKKSISIIGNIFENPNLNE